MHFRVKTTFYCLSLLLLLASCKTEEVQVPAYLYINGFKFTTKPDNSQGAASISETDVWLFQDGITKGVFGLPALIPIQTSGKTNLTFSPGIKRSGQDFERLIYRMYTSPTETRDLIAGKIDTFTPQITYVDNAKFALIEDFDGNGFAFEYNPTYKSNGDTILRVSGPGAWDETKNSGKVIIPDTIVEIYSKVFKTLPRFTPLYFELDYKNNLPFMVGLYATEYDGSGNATVTQFPVVVINAKNKWSKFYIDLEQEITGKKYGTEFRLFLRFDRSPDFSLDPQIFIDNLKLLYLE